MAFATKRFRPHRNWWWFFAALVGVPALGLGLLGLRTARVAEVERQQRIRDEQRRLAPSVDAALNKRLTGLQAGLLQDAKAGAPMSPGVRFEVDEADVLVFPADRVWFGEPARTPKVAGVSVRVQRQEAIDAAMTAEAQGHWADAAALYSKISASEPGLADWSTLAITRVRYRQGNTDALQKLSQPAWSHSPSRSPAGIPVALIAASAIEDVGPEERGRFVPLLRAVQEGLRAGRWWLSHEERQSFDAELTQFLASLSGSPPRRPDERLKRLATIERLARRAGVALEAGETRYFGELDGNGYLLLFVRSAGSPRACEGLALGRPELPRLIEEVINQSAGQRRLFEIGVRVRQSGSWLGKSALSDVRYAAPLEAARGWEMAFGPPAEDPEFNHQKLIWYGFIGLLFCLLLFGTAMTFHIVRREMELARLQGDFVAAVTHELRTPIASIRLLVERLVAKRVHEPRTIDDYFTAIRRETDRLERLINRVLEISRIQAGERRYHFESCALVPIVNSAIERARVRATAKRLELNVVIDGEIPELPLDRASISEAVDNLLDNAIQYSLPDTEIGVRLEARDSTVCLEIRDRGIGIDKDELSKIFSRFYRGRRGVRQNVKGTGLGLALVKASADAHGGSIHVTSVPNGGSTFWLTLPCTRGVEQHGKNSDRGR